MQYKSGHKSEPRGRKTHQLLRAIDHQNYSLTNRWSEQADFWQSLRLSFERPIRVFAPVAQLESLDLIVLFSYYHYTYSITKCQVKIYLDLYLLSNIPPGLPSLTKI
jgi:hypothetical protein